MTRTRTTPTSLLLAVVVLATACAAGGVATTGPEGGTFRIASAEPRTLDPAQAARPEEALLARQLFDGLVRYDDTTAAVVPNVATSWETSPDNTRFTFHLRARSTFSNGEIVTADNFVRAMTRALTPELYKDGRSHDLDGILGASDVVSGKAKTLAGARALDARTLEIRLSAPDAEFLIRCGDVAFYPIPSEAAMAAQRPSWARAPIGNGPFRLGAWNQTQSITLLPNPLHAGGRPRVGRVMVRFFGDLEAAYRAYRAGEVDWTAVPPARTVEVIRLGKKDHINRQLPALDYLVVATPGDPAAGALFRQALSLAIDRPMVTSDVFNRTAAAATGIVPPLMVGSASTSASEACASCAHPAGAPARARDLLARSGVKVTGVFALYFRPGVGQDAWMLDVARDLKATLGIDAQVLPAPASLSAEPTAAELLKASPPGAAAGLSWVMRYATAGDVLQPLMGSGGRDNASGYTNAAFDGLLSNARGSSDPALRAADYRRAERLVLEDLPIVPLWWPRGVRLARLRQWGGLGEDAFGGPTLRTVVAR